MLSDLSHHPHRHIVESTPLCIYIGGVDSYGASGLSNDLKVSQSFKTHAQLCPTATVHQDHSQVYDVQWTDPSLFQKIVDQLLLQAVRSHQLFSIKIGWAKFDQIQYIFESVQSIQNKSLNKQINIVWDPITHSSSDFSILNQKELNQLIKKYFKQITCITPNQKEFDLIEPEHKSKLNYIYLKKAVDKSVDCLFRNNTLLEPTSSTMVNIYFQGQNLKLNSDSIRGTGCILSSALAVGLSLGLDMTDSATFAKACMQSALSNTYSWQEKQIVDKISFPFKKDSLAKMYCAANDTDFKTQKQLYKNLSFEKMDTKHCGIYPIINSFEKLQQLANYPDIKLCQIRIKARNQSDVSIKQELKKCIDFAKQNDILLFINDFWQWAIELGAQAVHLGQEDLQTADLKAISDAKLYLGLSSHSYSEAALVKSIQPSYVALGPIFATKQKQMPFAPQGLQVLEHWLSLFSNIPVVAIGGINTENVNQIKKNGPQAIAVISDIQNSNSILDSKLKQWLQLLL